MKSLLARLRVALGQPDTNVKPRRLDWVFAAIFVAGAAAELIFFNTTWPWIQIEIAVLGAGLMIQRRRFPALALGITAAANGAFEIAATAFDRVNESTLGLALIGTVLMYNAWRRAKLSHAAIATGFFFVLLAIAELLAGEDVSTVFSLIFPWLVFALAGVVMRYRGNLAEASIEHARLAERNALARELHDTVAHHVSGIAVQAQAAQFVAKSDPEKALDSIKQIEDAANAAMDEMRQMVGILRSDDELTRSAGQSISDLARPMASPSVTVSGAEAADELTAPARTALFRIAQESVTNASRHSDGVSEIKIKLDLTDDTAVLQVTNDGVPTAKNSGSGFGLVGMRERVAALGGQLTSGPRPVGGWKVEALIPTKGTM